MSFEKVVVGSRSLKATNLPDRPDAECEWDPRAARYYAAAKTISPTQSHLVTLAARLNLVEVTLRMCHMFRVRGN